MLSASALVLLAVFLVISAITVLNVFKPFKNPLDVYFPSLWVLICYLLVVQFIGAEVAIWILCVLSLAALREYFSLIAVRPEDRLPIAGAYLAIPITSLLIMTGQYQGFILFIPVYGVFITALLATLPGYNSKGIVFSLGAINFGLFLFGYCIGHLGYLTRLSPWLPAMLILNVTICDLFAIFVGRDKRFSLTKTLMLIPATALISLALSGWTELNTIHALLLGAATPLLVALSRRTLWYLEEDLGIDKQRLQPGKGKLIDPLKSYLYAAPVILHYITYIKG
ncbi:hypothetical protein [Amphritea sp. HPY]|uniref:hypothetical protein n=1 Tax=Amphritea sp. HPY TaxID=3421652 RepID=UPI003D7E09BE